MRRRSNNTQQKHRYREEETKTQTGEESANEKGEKEPKKRWEEEEEEDCLIDVLGWVETQRERLDEKNGDNNNNNDDDVGQTDQDPSHTLLRELGDNISMRLGLYGDQKEKELEEQDDLIDMLLDASIARPVLLRVGEESFVTTRSSLTKENSMLSSLVSGRFPSRGLSFSGNFAFGPDRGETDRGMLLEEFFVKRDGEMFRHILQYLRSQKLTLPRGFTDHERLAQEADFFGMDNLLLEIETNDFRKPLSWLRYAIALHAADFDHKFVELQYWRALGLVELDPNVPSFEEQLALDVSSLSPSQPDDEISFLKTTPPLWDHPTCSVSDPVPDPLHVRPLDAQEVADIVPNLLKNPAWTLELPNRDGHDPVSSSSSSSSPEKHGPSLGARHTLVSPQTPSLRTSSSSNLALPLDVSEDEDPVFVEEQVGQESMGASRFLFSANSHSSVTPTNINRVSRNSSMDDLRVSSAEASPRADRSSRGSSPTRSSLKRSSSSVITPKNVKRVDLDTGGCWVAAVLAYRMFLSQYHPTQVLLQHRLEFLVMQASPTDIEQSEKILNFFLDSSDSSNSSSLLKTIYGRLLELSNIPSWMPSCNPIACPGFCPITVMDERLKKANEDEHEKQRMKLKLQRAFDLYKEASVSPKNVFPLSHNFLGLCHFYGLPQSRDFSEDFHTKSLFSSDLISSLCFTVSPDLRVVSPDTQKSLQCFLSATEADVHLGRYNLGINFMYGYAQHAHDQGDEDEQGNRLKATNYLRLASLCGNPFGHLQLRLLLFMSNDASAPYHFTQAAKSGLPAALDHLTLFPDQSHPSLIACATSLGLTFDHRKFADVYPTG